VAGGEQGLAEVASDNLFGIANGSQVDAEIPANQYIDIRRYMFQLGMGKSTLFLLVVSPIGVFRCWMCRVRGIPRLDGKLQKRLEQLGDPGSVHRGSVYRGANPDCKRESGSFGNLSAQRYFAKCKKTQLAGTRGSLGRRSPHPTQV